MTFALAVDDFSTELEARDVTRARLERHITFGDEGEDSPGPSASTDGLIPHTAPWYAQRDKELRDNWGHDDVAQWVT